MKSHITKNRAAKSAAAADICLSVFIRSVLFGAKLRIISETSKKVREKVILQYCILHSLFCIKGLMSKVK